MTQTLALGIDIGGTNTSFGIVNRRGEIVAKGGMRTKDYPVLSTFLQALKKEISPLLEQVGHENIAGCGVGAPNGNFYTGEIAFAPNLPWEGVIPLAKLIGDTFQMKVTLTNDANAAALGEMMYGAAKGMKDFILVTLGTGVGSGFVSNGQMIYGADGFAGELGHVISVRDGRLCGCGRHGCLEQYTSASGIIKTAELWLEERDDETVLRPLKGKVGGRDIHHAAENGDAFALEIFNYTAKILGQTLADAVAITSPEAIIFFGGLAKSGDLLLAPAHLYMEMNLLRVYKNKVQFIQSALPDSDAAILGASALVW
ncbi:ROK family protein [Taibaiella soli]|uniref:ROK family protein n=1 Tax=Taibaiella soli TaxID=1649169 RepID=A0A2W2A798_9BACT|nr:ROK family protein [Taibaiella soli]PZF71101.1 ROK family protein [Taibaiella soli]